MVHTPPALPPLDPALRNTAYMDRRYAAGFGTVEENSNLEGQLTRAIQDIAMRRGLADEYAYQLKVEVYYEERPRPGRIKKFLHKNVNEMGKTLTDVTGGAIKGKTLATPMPDNDPSWSPVRITISGFDVQLPHNNGEMKKVRLEGLEKDKHKDVHKEFAEARRANHEINKQLKDIRDEFVRRLEPKLERTKGTIKDRVSNGIQRIKNYTKGPVHRDFMWEGLRVHKAVTFKGSDLTKMVKAIDDVLIRPQLGEGRVIQYTPSKHHSREATDTYSFFGDVRGSDQLARLTAERERADQTKDQGPALP